MHIHQQADKLSDYKPSQLLSSYSTPLLARSAVLYCPKLEKHKLCSSLLVLKWTQNIQTVRKFCRESNFAIFSTKIKILLSLIFYRWNVNKKFRKHVKLMSAKGLNHGRCFLCGFTAFRLWFWCLSNNHSWCTYLNLNCGGCTRQLSGQCEQETERRTWEK